MVTTRDLEQVVEDALLEAGVSPESARAVTSRLGDDLILLATKQDVEDGFSQVNQRIDETAAQLNQRIDETAAQLNQRIDETASQLERQIDQTANRLDKRIDEATGRAEESNRRLREELINRMDSMERSMWRLAVLGFGMWSATFGALMYAIFG